MYKDMKGEMVKFPFVAGPDMPIADAETYMKECNIRHLPVMSEANLIGVVSERDLLAHKTDRDPENPNLTATLGDIMIDAPFVVHETESLATVVNIMAHKKYGCALVLDANDHLVGIFTTIDALRLLEKFLGRDPKFYDKPEDELTLKDAVSWC